MSSLLHRSCGIWAFWECRLWMCAVFSSFLFLLYFNIIQPGHNLHATLVLSTKLFSFSLWPSMCSVQLVVSWSMSTKHLCVLGRFLHVTYLYRDNITYCILILIEKRICVHFHVIRAKSLANIFVDITSNFFSLLTLFLISSSSVIISASWNILLKCIRSLSYLLLSFLFQKTAYYISWSHVKIVWYLLMFPSKNCWRVMQNKGMALC